MTPTRPARGTDGCQARSPRASGRGGPHERDHDSWVTTGRPAESSGQAEEVQTP